MVAASALMKRHFALSGAAPARNVHRSVLKAPQKSAAALVTPVLIEKGPPHAHRR
jgi:hypothetical protein